MRLKELLKKTAVTACAAAMTITLVAGSGMVAKADDPTPIAGPTIDTTEGVTGSLTIHKYVYNGTATLNQGTGNSTDTVPNAENDKATPLDGVVFSYVKVADISTVSTTAADAGDVEVKYTTTEAAFTYLGLGTETNKSGNVVTQSDLEAALTGKKDKLEGATGLTPMGATNKSGVASVNGLPLGVYLVVETKVPENVHTTENPFLVSIPMTDSVSTKNGETTTYDGTKWNYDVHVFPKNQTDNPTIKKTVKDDQDKDFADTTSVSMGDAVSYKVTSTLPTISSKATYLTQYTFVDTLASGLSFVKNTDSAQNVTISFNDGKDGATKTEWKTNTDLDTVKSGSQAPFTVTYDGTNNTMTIAFTTEGLAAINPGMSGKTMTITYSATVDKDATDHAVMGDSGNANTVALTFKRSGENTQAETITDKAIVYTYGLDLTKKFADDTATQKGDKSPVQFILKRTNTRKITVNKVETETETGNEEYVVATAVENKNEDETTTKTGEYYASGTNTEANATKFSPNADGSLKIYGLEADTYTLTEVKTASGYSLLKEPITIVITPSGKMITADSLNASGTVVKTSDGNLTVATATVDTNPVTMLGDDGQANRNAADATDDKEAVIANSHNALVPLTITNTKSFTLPMTGGLGAIICTVCGAFAIGGAIVIITRNKRRTA